MVNLGVTKKTNIKLDFIKNLSIRYAGSAAIIAQVVGRGTNFQFYKSFTELSRI